MTKLNQPEKGGYYNCGGVFLQVTGFRGKAPVVKIGIPRSEVHQAKSWDTKWGNPL
ncbi:hypothetical protein D3C74_49340 [compost metagenome]